MGKTGYSRLVERGYLCFSFFLHVINLCNSDFNQVREQNPLFIFCHPRKFNQKSANVLDLLRHMFVSSHSIAP